MRVAQAANAKVFAITNNNTSRSALQIEYNLPKSQVFCIQDGNLVDLVLEQTNKRGVTFAINTNSRDQRMAEVVQRCASALGKVVEVRRETDSAESSTSQVQVFSIAAIQVSATLLSDAVRMLICFSKCFVKTWRYVNN